MALRDTIVAISTPYGRSGVGIVRISGPESVPIAQVILRFEVPGTWLPRHATLASLVDKAGQTLDKTVTIRYEAPRSYTGEDVVEICCHGSPVVLRAAVDLACANGARLAEPGEFTLRAFLNGRLDLPQAEAVRDLIEARTLYQARVAAQQVEGSVSHRIAPLKNQLLELIALLEAGIDFAEDDVAVASPAEILNRLAPIEAETSRLVSSFAYGKLVHDGLVLAIVGRPNVGKSSLFNRLLEQDRAIVTPIPGTTRDLVSETGSLRGIPVKFMDTAGIREGNDLIESMGIERSIQAMADADLTVVVIDSSAPFEHQDRALVDKASAGGRFLLAANKCDLPRQADLPGDAIMVSALTGEGIEQLRERMIAAIAPDGGVEQEAGFLTSLRHEQLLLESSAYLAKATQAVLAGMPHEMLLLDLYAALRPVDAVTGATTADDILNRIFSTFCIGK